MLTVELFVSGTFWLCPEIFLRYHARSYDLDGNLTNVAFEKGIKGDGGMASEFRKEEYQLRYRIAEFSDAVWSQRPPLRSRTIWAQRFAAGLRVLHKPLRILGRNTQILPNNWKLYMENVKDSYHASILHCFSRRSVLTDSLSLAKSLSTKAVVIT